MSSLSITMKEVIWFFMVLDFYGAINIASSVHLFAWLFVVYVQPLNSHKTGHLILHGFRFLWAINIDLSVHFLRGCACCRVHWKVNNISSIVVLNESFPRHFCSPLALLVQLHPGIFPWQWLLERWFILDFLPSIIVQWCMIYRILEVNNLFDACLCDFFPSTIIIGWSCPCLWLYRGSKALWTYTPDCTSSSWALHSSWNTTGNPLYKHDKCMCLDALVSHAWMYWHWKSSFFLLVNKRWNHHKYTKMDTAEPTHGEWLCKSRNIQQYLSRLAHKYRVAALEEFIVHHFVLPTISFRGRMRFHFELLVSTNITPF